MSILKLPWFSLLLVLLTYIALGWLLFRANIPGFMWVVVAIIVIVLVANITTPWAKVADIFRFLFSSNARSFAIAVLSAFMLFLILAWFRLFLDISLVTSALILARLDFQVAGFKETQAFMFTCASALTGLGLGALTAEVFR